jgi:serine/threonine protein kinase/Tfp pilus assembly protein PilF
MVGAGGMGAVYEAFDRELESIAIKLILPEYSGRMDLERRFRDEILLARHITHPNVVRIFSLERDRNLLFITMEFVNGQDLASLLSTHGKYAPREAAEIVHQAVSGIEAVHRAGVFHRDLKTRNLMRQPDGRVVVMDFGLARPLDDASRTVTNGLVGTFAYMAPEQLRGEPSDQRADLYALGLMFHELLTGRLPSLAESKQEKRRDILSEAISSQATGRSTAKADRELNRIVRKCLEESPNNRYQSAKELKNDIWNWLFPPKPLPRFTPWSVGAAAIPATLAIVLSFFVLRSHVPPPHPPVTVLVADFENLTGDPIFSNGMLESVCGVALEGSPFISLFSRGAAHKELKQLADTDQLTQDRARMADTDQLTQDRARMIATREGVQSVVSGSLKRNGDQYEIQVSLVDIDGKTPLPLRQFNASSRATVVSAVGDAAQAIRRALGEKKPSPLPETFTSLSLEAIHAYAVAQELSLEGKGTEAVPEYLHAIALDPKLGRAYSGLAVVYRNKHRIPEALKYFEEALKHFDRMTEREKFRTRGAYYVTKGLPEKAIKEYMQLVAQFPADNAGYANLALAYSLKRDMANAIVYGGKAVDIYPKNVAQRTNLGWYLMFGEKPADAIAEATQASNNNHSYEKAYLVKALANLVQGNIQDATQAYSDLRGTSAEGTSFATLGLADLWLYSGRTEDATRLLKEGSQVDLFLGNEGAAATELVMLAQAQLTFGHKNEALETALRVDALKGKLDGTVFQLAQVFVKLKPERAAEIASEMSTALDPDRRSNALLLTGELALQKHDLSSATANFEDAIRLVDTWLGHYDSGLAHLQSREFLEADSEFETCIRRRGEATSLFIDDNPTFRYFPPVYYYHGLAEDGLGTNSVQWYQKFLSIKVGGGPDPMIPDARSHIDKSKQ